MTSLRPQPRCPVCGHDGRRPIGRRGDRPLPALLGGEAPSVTVEVVACRRCGHYYCDPLPSPEQLASLYADASSYFPDSADDRYTGALGFMADVVATTGIEHGRLLDVGSGQGRLLAAARDAGWQATGIEPTASFAAETLAEGLDVHVGYLDAAFRPDEPYDVVCALAVLEHVPDPLDFLHQVRRVTRPGGLVLLEVPNGRRPDAFALDRLLRLRGVPWTVRTAPLQAPFHLSEFSTRSLGEALRRTGFDVVSLRAVPGRVPYPLPGGLRQLIRLVEVAGGRFGAGLNLLATGRATDG